MLMFDKFMDVTGMLKQGENILTITLVSSCRNLYGPFHLRAQNKPHIVGPDTGTRYGKWKTGENLDYSPVYMLEKFGVNGLELT